MYTITTLSAVDCRNQFDETCETMNGLMDTKGLTIPKLLSIVLGTAFSDSIDKTVFVVKIENKIVGLATVIIDRKLGHQPKNGVAFLEDIVIHNDYQNKGYGSALVRHCINFAKNNDCYKCILSCKTNKIGYYRSFGFYDDQTTMRINL